MTKQITILCLLLFTGIISLTAQSDLEKEILSEIAKIDEDVFDALSKKMNIKPILKRYKEVAKRSKDNHQLGAIVNSKIGQALTKKHYEKEATKFLIQAYKHRKRQGDFFPQRWALKSLINNGLNRGDFKFAFKYMKIWMKHSKTHPEKLTEVHKYSYSEERSISIEIEYFLERLQPLRKYKKYGIKSPYFQEGRKYIPKLLKYCYKIFPEYKSSVSQDGIALYALLIQTLVENNYDELAFEVKNQSVKFLKKNASPEYYAFYVKNIATWFRKSQKNIHPDYGFSFETNGTKTTKHEAIGIELIEEYIRVNKKIAKPNEVLFGYRYIATRHIILEDYQKAVQYLATAIKYCHEYKLEEQIVKSIGGLHEMLSIIVNYKDKNALVSAKKWKDNYSLKGLEAEDIRRIEKILNTANDEM